MDNRPVQLEKHPVREFYQRNNKVLNTLLMCILVFILGEIIIGAVMGTHGTFLSVSQVFLTIRLAAFVALFGLCQQLAADWICPWAISPRFPVLLPVT